MLRPCFRVSNFRRAVPLTTSMTEPSAPPPLAFDDVVIDFAGRRLLRGGQPQPLEPKAFDVLALLAVAPGHAFARDDILDAVWGHRHVTPGVLNRVMTLLRHALGEDANTPRYLHTLHGVGYRFDLPAQSASDAHERRSQADRRATPSPTRLAGRRRWPLFAALLLAALCGIALWRFWPAHDAPSPAKTAATMPTLVVMPLKSIGGDVGGRAVADGMGEELIGSLAQIEGLRVIARESTAIAASESAELPELIRRLGITHALEGSLQQAGQRLRIRLRLIEADSGRTLWAKDFDRDATEVLALQREIARAVAASLALKMGLATAPAAKSGDADYLRRYLATRALLNRRTGTLEETVEMAETEFRALTRERPDDARVHASLAAALDIRAYRRPALAATLRAESLQEASLAQRLDPSLPEPYLIQARAACRSNRWESCLELLAQARSRAPSFAPISYEYGFAMAQLGYLDRAEATMREAVARDPINPGRRFALGRMLDTRGKHEEALAQLDRSDAFANYARWFNAVWRRDYAAATRIADTGFDNEAVLDTYGPKLKPSYVATTRALIDPSHWPAAKEEMRKFERDTGLMNFCRVLAPDAAAEAPDLIAKLDVLRERSYSSWDLLLWTKDLAYLRRDPAFQAYLRDNGILAYWQRHGMPKQCRVVDGAAVCD